MLLYGNGFYIMDESIVYNLNSMKEGFPRFRYLTPPNSLGYCTSYEFDLAYYNYIFNNDVVFKEFFDIIYELYCGRDVMILIDQSQDWSENIAETLFKVIQQRYGYNAILVNSFEDYIYAKNNLNPGFNSQFGIYNLDIDRERYTMIVEGARLRNGGNLIYAG